MDSPTRTFAVHTTKTMSSSQSGSLSRSASRRAPPVPPRSNSTSQAARPQVAAPDSAAVEWSPTASFPPGPSSTSTRGSRHVARQSLPATFGRDDVLGPSAAGFNPFRARVPSQASVDPAPRPPLPPRRQSRGPALPPRPAPVPAAYSDSSSLHSLKSIESAGLQPTSHAPPSRLMQQSLAAAASSPNRSPQKSAVVQVIKTSSSDGHPGEASASAAPRMAGRSGEIIQTVSKALKASEDDRPLAPPQRRVSVRAKPDGLARSGTIRRDGPRRWATGDILAERPRALHAVILLNQPITRKDIFYRVWQSSTLRYCADGGANRLFDGLDDGERERFLPTMIKGDLDSLRPDVRMYYANRGVAIKKDPSEYSTDLQKCIDEVEAVERASNKKFSVILLGGLSGRVDQTVHVMSLLHKTRKHRSIYVLSEESLAFVLDEGSHELEIDHAAMGQTCGILPVGISEAHVKTSGLKWDLDGPTSFDGLVSSSNHLLPDEPVVRLQTDKPILWTTEIKSLPVRPVASHAPDAGAAAVDGLTRGAKALSMGLARAAEDVGRGLQGRQRLDAESEGLIDGYSRLS